MALKVALANVETFLANKTGHQCSSTLIPDEVKVQKAVAFNRGTYRLYGLVDYGDQVCCDTAADHALVVMFVPLCHCWIRPIASFATNNPAPGAILARLVLQAIMKLKIYNVIVVAVISVGATTKKSIWSCFEISGKLEDPNHKIEHLSPYFLCDVLSIIKRV